MKNYDSYTEYLDHQSLKLKNHYKTIIAIDSKYEKTVYNRYKDLFDFKNKTVLCLGARLGGEVRAFKQLNSLCIGIDINPGELNSDVLYGDFHNVKFPDNVFDFIFSNSIDHVYDIEKFIDECRRLIKSDGKVLLEIAIQKAGEYETINTLDISGIVEKLIEPFYIEQTININNGWKGQLLILTPKY